MEWMAVGCGVSSTVLSSVIVHMYFRRSSDGMLSYLL